MQSPYQCAPARAASRSRAPFRLIAPIAAWNPAARRDALYRRLLAVADVVAAGFALLLSVSLLGDDRLTLATLAILPLVVLVSKAIGLYDRDELLLRKTTLDEAPALFQLVSCV